MSIWVLPVVALAGVIAVGFVVCSVMNDVDENCEPKEHME